MPAPGARAWRCRRRRAASAAALLRGAVTADGATDPAQLRQPQFLITHGGWSYYKVWIDPTQPPWLADHPITDDVVAATCMQARGDNRLGGNTTAATGAGAPCASSDASCRYSTAHCARASEEGCESPFLATAVAMGCAGAADPRCRDAAHAALSGTNHGCLWAHRGLAWDDRGACGVCRCARQRWAACDDLEAVCQEGMRHVTGGARWPGCAPGGSGAGSCATSAWPDMRGWPDTPMEHWAFCVGRAECRCAHGTCDIASDDGRCIPGSCSPGWFGAHCERACNPSFCLNRQDESVIPPPNSIPSDGHAGIWTTPDNECYCECLPQYEPSGTGAQGTVCGHCMQPQQQQCTVFTEVHIDSDTQPRAVAAGEYFEVHLWALISDSGQVDRSFNNIVTVMKDPGGGNGDGGMLVVHTSNLQMSQGELVMHLELTQACTACYLVFKDDEGLLQPYRWGPLQVTTAATHLLPITAPHAVYVGDPVRVIIDALDGPVGGVGSVDVGNHASVTARLRGGGGNGGGCGIAPYPPSFSLTQRLEQGKAEWIFSFQCACDACVVAFDDVSGKLPPVLYHPIEVRARGRRLRCRTPANTSCDAAPIRLMRGDGAFDFFIEAVDEAGNLDHRSWTTVQLQKIGDSGSANNGGQMLNYGGTKGLLQQVEDGRVRFSISFTEACAACTVRVQDVGNKDALHPYTLPLIVVYTVSHSIHIVGMTPARVNVGEQFTVVTEAQDDGLNRDFSWNGLVNATLQPHGGNGDGGSIVNYGGDKPLQARFVNGTYTWLLHFTQSCVSCIIDFVDASPNESGRIMTAHMSTITVYTRRVRLKVREQLPASLPANEPFEMVIMAVDMNGNTDVLDNGLVILSLQPGGGNGDGGVLTDGDSLNRTLTQGITQYTPWFSRACSACMLEVKHAHDVPTLLLGPINVYSPATKLVFVSDIPRTVSRDNPFELELLAVDDYGAVDTGLQSSFRVEKESDSDGGINDGGELTNAGSASQLVQRIAGGRLRWSPQYGAACQACFLQVRDLGGDLPVLKTDAIEVTTRALRLWPASPWAAPSEDTGAVAKTVRRGEPYDIVIAAVDEHFDKDLTNLVAVQVSLEPEGGNGGGAPLESADASGRTFADGGAFAQYTRFGEATFRVRHPRACSACRLTFVGGAGVRPVTTPPVRVVTSASRIAASPAPPGRVPSKTDFDVRLIAVDEDGDLDVEWGGSVAVELLPDGGNGGGGTLRNQQGGSQLVHFMTDGVLVYHLSFTAACLRCMLRVTTTPAHDPHDEHDSAELPALMLGPIEVTTRTATLRLERGAPAAEGVVEVDVSAVDGDGNVNTGDSDEVTLLWEGGDGRRPAQGGGPVRLTGGRATLAVRTRGGCGACVLVAPHPKGDAVLRLRAPGDARAPADGGDAEAAAAAAAGTPAPPRADSDLIFWILLGVVLCLIVVCCAGGAIAAARREAARERRRPRRARPRRRASGGDDTKKEEPPGVGDIGGKAPAAGGGSAVQPAPTGDAR